MIAFRVKSSYAFFKRQQTFVYFRSLQSPLSIITLAIGSALRPRQVDEKHFAEGSAALPDIYLANGVGPGRTIVRSSRVRRPHTVAVVNYLLHFARRKGLSLLEAEHLNFIVFVFQDL